MRKINIFLVGVVCALAINSYAQENSSGQVYAAQGNDFIVLSKGKRILYSAERLNEGTIIFERGDIFQTGSQSFAEIQFGRNGPLLKIAENTSVGFSDSRTSQSLLTLNLLYGRIRVRNVSSGPLININSGNALVEVKQGDVGVDYIIRSGTQASELGSASISPVLYVSNLSGEASVYPVNNEVSAIPHLLVHAGETVSVEFVNSLSYVERRSLGENTINFWKANDFSALPPQQPVTASAEKAAEPASNVKEMPYVPKPAEQAKSAGKMKNAAIVGGILFCLGGMALEGLSVFSLASGDYQTGSFYSMSGILTSGIGILTLFAALSIDSD